MSSSEKTDGREYRNAAVIAIMEGIRKNTPAATNKRRGEWAEHIVTGSRQRGVVTAYASPDLLVAAEERVEDYFDN